MQAYLYIHVSRAFRGGIAVSKCAPPCHNLVSRDGRKSDARHRSKGIYDCARRRTGAYTPHVLFYYMFVPEGRTRDAPRGTACPDFQSIFPIYIYIYGHTSVPSSFPPCHRPVPRRVLCPAGVFRRGSTGRVCGGACARDERLRRSLFGGPHGTRVPVAMMVGPTANRRAHDGRCKGSNAPRSAGQGNGGKNKTKIV